MEEELNRVEKILERVEAWGKSPALPPGMVCELTGLSYTRVYAMIQTGLFDLSGETGQTRVEYKSLVRYLRKRFSKLSAAGKCKLRGTPARRRRT